jgi:CheY-like chemotaxis protein/HPt (histidine-containing phosphotransfer) domain-containing protein
MRILVAEDTEMNRDLLVELLENRGHSVVAVGDGVAAIAALAQHDFGVVLMDEEMPRMNGLEATAAIRRMESSSGKRQFIVAMSGNISEQDQKRYLDAGADMFLAKPATMEKLYEAVESVAGVGTQAAQKTAASVAQDTPDEDVLSHLRRATRGNEKLMRSLVRTFLADAPKTMTAMRRAILKENADELACRAHSLKGALAIFDARKAVAVARTLEAMGRSRNLASADAEFRALNRELARLKRDLAPLESKKKPVRRRFPSRPRRKR